MSVRSRMTRHQTMTSYSGLCARPTSDICWTFTH